MASNDAAITILILAAAGTLFYGPWQWVCTDWMRQICFEARDQLFDVAADGHLNFESSEYRELRRAIEGEIRFAHEITLPYIIVLAAYFRFAKPQVMQAARQADRDMKSGISDETTRLKVERIFSDMDKRVLLVVMLKSPVLLTLPVLIIAPLFLCVRAVKVYTRWAVRLINSMIAAASYIFDRSGDDFSDRAAI